MLLTPAMQDRLIAAWHGPLTAATVARTLRLSSYQVVQRFWQLAKSDGRLPADRPRPYFAERSAPIPVAVLPPAVDVADDCEGEISDEEIALESSLVHAANTAASAALLAALRAAHGDLDHPQFHSYHTAPRRLGGIGV